ncbi:MAG TPA: LCP family protein [Actinomycetota bacterium]|nr:LCP family protein [Actinomycetota bacterium]
MTRFFKREPDPFSANRYSGIVRDSARRGGGRFPHWWQRALVGSAVLILLVGGYGLSLYLRLNSGLKDPDSPTLPQTDEGEPFTALLVGSDSRSGLSEEEQLALGAAAVGGERADTLILAHIDPATNRLIMVQFPRDLYVPILDEGEDRINSALQEGPRHLVSAVTELTGLDINRYVQVNIAGFRDLVDEIGGVDVCVEEPIPFDPQTGLEITPDEVGMVHFDGDRALRFVRSRRFPSGDFQRIQNQQKFLAAAIEKVTSVSTLLNPVRLSNLVDIAGTNVKTDVSTTVAGLKRLLDRFSSFDPQYYEAYIAPNLGTMTSPQGASVVAPDFDALELMFDAIAANESPQSFDGIPDVDMAAISVGVYDGTGGVGVAEAAAEALEEATATGTGPVEIAAVGEWERSRSEDTVVLYRQPTRSAAEVVQAAVPQAELKMTARRLPDGIDVALIVGQEFETKPIVQLVPLDLPEPAALPKECSV